LEQFLVGIVNKKYGVDVADLVYNEPQTHLRDRCTTFTNPLFPSSGRMHLLNRILKITQIRVRKRSYQIWKKNPKMLDKMTDFMIEADLEQICERVKHMNIIDHAQGYILKITAYRAAKDETHDLLIRAMKRFESALKSNPTNKYTLRNLAHVQDSLYDLSNIEVESLPSIHLNTLLHSCVRYYKAAIRADPSDVFTLSQYASFLLFKGHPREASEYLLRILEINPFFESAFLNLRWCASCFGLPEIEKKLGECVSEGTSFKDVGRTKTEVW